MDLESTNSSPIINLVDKILIQALSSGTSDIHIEPQEDGLVIRLRHDGVLEQLAVLPKNIIPAITSRLKIMADLDIAERRLPQDGRIRRMFRGRVFDLRVSTLPTLFGEKLVVRILSSDLEKLNLDRLGYATSDQQQLRESLQKPHGIILVTGPTGSGKSQSLYACLNLLNKTEVNIASVEDPSEIQLPGVNQVNVKEKIGLNFATTLRAFLRQDPDVLMVGEIRDHETADMAIKASQTGHLVLSTLHTQDAPSALVRLRNMGMTTYNLASSISLISAQRLVRCLCRHCKVPVVVSSSLLKDLGWQFSEVNSNRALHFYSAQGCAQCHKGYWGRIGIFQLMLISPSLQHLILQDAGRNAFAAQAEKEGVISLRHAGLLQAALGITSISEVLAHTDVH